MTAGHLVLAQLTVGAVSLLVNVLSARVMGPQGRGTFALLLQVTYLVNLLAMAGVDRAYPATVTGRPPVGRATADVLRLVLPSTALLLGAVAPLTVLIRDAGTSGVVTAAGFAMTTSALVVGLAVRTGATAAGAGRPYLLATVVGQVALLVVAGTLTASGVTSPDRWLVGYGAALAAVPLAAWLLLRDGRRATATEALLPPATDELLPGSRRTARRLGLRLLPATVATMVMLRADRLLLPALGSYEQLGRYVVVATVTEFVVWPVQSWVDAQIPRWHQRFLAGELRPGAPLAAAAGYGVVAGVALLVAGHFLLVPVLGPAYRSSADLIAPLALGAVGYGVSRVGVGLCVAAGRARAVLAADIPAMIVALGAYAVLIPRHGPMGAAVGSALGYGVGALLAVLLCRGKPRPPVTVPDPGTRSTLPPAASRS